MVFQLGNVIFHSIENVQKKNPNLSTDKDLEVQRIIYEITFQFSHCACKRNQSRTNQVLRRMISIQQQYCSRWIAQKKNSNKIHFEWPNQSNIVATTNRNSNSSWTESTVVQFLFCCKLWSIHSQMNTLRIGGVFILDAYPNDCNKTKNVCCNYMQESVCQNFRWIFHLYRLSLNPNWLHSQSKYMRHGHLHKNIISMNQHWKCISHTLESNNRRLHNSYTSAIFKNSVDFWIGDRNWKHDFLFPLCNFPNLLISNKKLTTTVNDNEFRYSFKIRTLAINTRSPIILNKQSKNRKQKSNFHLNFEIQNNNTKTKKNLSMNWIKKNVNAQAAKNCTANYTHTRCDRKWN